MSPESSPLPERFNLLFVDYFVFLSFSPRLIILLLLLTVNFLNEIPLFMQKEYD